MASGLTPLPFHVQAIVEHPQPTSVKELQRLLGFINFYSCFVPHAAAILCPLTDALIGSPKLLTWTSTITQAFLQAKQALAHATFLAHPHPTAPLSLTTSASASHIGGVLQQQINDHWQPLSSFL